jgi:hypothetical protein
MMELQTGRIHFQRSRGGVDRTYFIFDLISPDVNQSQIILQRFKTLFQNGIHAQPGDPATSAFQAALQSFGFPEQLRAFYFDLPLGPFNPMPVVAVPASPNPPRDPLAPEPPPPIVDWRTEILNVEIAFNVSNTIWQLHGAFYDQAVLLAVLQTVDLVVSLTQSRAAIEEEHTLLSFNIISPSVMSSDYGFYAFQIPSDTLHFIHAVFGSPNIHLGAPANAVFQAALQLFGLPSSFHAYLA